MAERVVITGIGMVTPSGMGPSDVLHNIANGISAAKKTDFGDDTFVCPKYAPVEGFDAEKYFPENKTLRLMNRDARMAVVASRMAMEDASVIMGETYQPEEVGLYGSTGVMGMGLDEVARLIKNSSDANGLLDLKHFGSVTLKRVRPVLSFKLLANMPICFVSIFENIRGDNAVYTPWEGQGAQALEAAYRAVKRGNVPCVLVGGCDVKTHLFSFINMQQVGVFDSWRKQGGGCVPGEGAGFLVLENETAALKRGAKIYARLKDCRIRSHINGNSLTDTYNSVLSQLNTSRQMAVIASGDGDISIKKAEDEVLTEIGLDIEDVIRPKSYVGNLFAAAAAVQVGLAAREIYKNQRFHKILANCFGYGSEQGAFVLEKPCKEL